MVVFNSFEAWRASAALQDVAQLASYISDFRKTYGGDNSDSHSFLLSKVSQAQKEILPGASNIEADIARSFYQVLLRKVQSDVASSLYSASSNADSTTFRDHDVDRVAFCSQPYIVPSDGQLRCSSDVFDLLPANGGGTVQVQLHRNKSLAVKLQHVVVGEVRHVFSYCWDLLWLQMVVSTGFTLHFFELGGGRCDTALC
jgi:hypothetical protein